MVFTLKTPAAKNTLINRMGTKILVNTDNKLNILMEKKMSLTILCNSSPFGDKPTLLIHPKITVFWPDAEK